MNTRPFNNTATYSEKVETLKQDRSAYLRDAIAKPAQSGRDPTNVWPRLLAGPWSAQPGPGLESPLGYSVEALSERRRSR
jgi:hypothetical protein